MFQESPEYCVRVFEWEWDNACVSASTAGVWYPGCDGLGRRRCASPTRFGHGGCGCLCVWCIAYVGAYVLVLAPTVDCFLVAVVPCMSQSYMYIRLLSLGLTFYSAFDDAVSACKKLCRVSGLGVRLLVRTSNRVRVCGLGVHISWVRVCVGVLICTAAVVR